MANWSGLPSDIVHLISSCLSLPDHHRFSAVCRDWRVVAKEKRLHAFAPQLPWLVLGEDAQTKKRNFFNLSERKHYSIDIPEMRGKYVCGSSSGWLFLMDIQIRCHLFNPFSRESIELPPLPPYSYDFDTIISEEPALNSQGQEIGYSFKEMQRHMILKAVLFHYPKQQSNFTAMIIYGEYRLLALWRHGDDNMGGWTIVKYPDDELVCLTDAIYFQGNIYAVCSSNGIFVVDGHGGSGDPQLRRINPQIPLFKKHETERYFVEFKGELLLLLRFEIYRRKKRKDFTKEFWVLKLDVKRETLEELEDIDDFAVFVGNNSPVIVDPSVHPGCVENGVYFGDMCTCHHWLEYGHDFGIYDIVDEIILQFCPMDDRFLPGEAPLVWLT